jgi:hypothetical protein
MGRFVHTGEPYINGNTLVWQATLDPTAEYVSAGSANDHIDFFRMEANDPSGIDAHSTELINVDVPFGSDVLPGDNHIGQLGLDLRSGYWQAYLTIDERDSQVNLELRISVHEGTYELKNWFVSA